MWRWVRAWTLRTLEKAGERVADVHGVDEEEEEEEPQPTTPNFNETSDVPPTENREDQ